MKMALLVTLALLQAGAPPGERDVVRHLRVQRPIKVSSGSHGQTCAVLDAEVYAHAESESLNDVRLFAVGGSTEIPFTLTESHTERMEIEPATVRNLGMQGSAIVFDLEMPKRPYTAVELTLEAKDFEGSAKVWGRSKGGHDVALGEFTVFDLSSRHLSRYTMLPLQESSFPELRVELLLQAVPGAVTRILGSAIVRGASVPPSREAQTLYTPVASADVWVQRGHESVATLRLPPHVPVARAEIALDSQEKRNFLREVTLSAEPDQRGRFGSAGSEVDTVSGEISQLHLPSALGPRGVAEPTIDHRQMDIEAVLAANLRGPATVEVAVADGNDTPLRLRSVQLEMRQRKICFEANPEAAGYTLMYGGKDLPAPEYAYSRMFRPGAAALTATLGPEQLNPQFVPGTDAGSLREKHTDSWWIALLAGLGVLAGMALRGIRHRQGAAR